MLTTIIMDAEDGMEMTELNGGCMPCALVKKIRPFHFQRWMVYYG
jgi:hypothetical protein